MKNLETIIILSIIIFTIHTFSTEAEAYIIKQDAREVKIAAQKSGAFEECLDYVENSYWCLRNIL